MVGGSHTHVVLLSRDRIVVAGLQALMSYRGEIKLEIYLDQQEQLAAALHLAGTMRRVPFNTGHAKMQCAEETEYLHIRIHAGR